MADLIDRQALKESISAVFNSGHRKTKEQTEGAWEIINLIFDAPTAQPTRSELRRMAIQNEVFPVKRGECDTCFWHDACNWETLMKDRNIEHEYCAAYIGADMREESENESL